MRLHEAIEQAQAAGYTMIETAGGRRNLDTWPDGRDHDKFRASVGWEFDGKRLIGAVTRFRANGKACETRGYFPLARYVAPFVYVSE